MKKNVIEQEHVLWDAFLLLTGCSTNDNHNNDSVTPTETEQFVYEQNENDLSKDLQAEENNEFFPKSQTPLRYAVRSSLLEEEEAELIVTEREHFDNGTVYELRIDSDEEIAARDNPDWDRRILGYLYVESDKIYLLGHTGAELSTYETYKGAEDFIANGTIICQEEAKEDVLADAEEGWHEYILSDGDRREYHGYSNLVETGFYEHFYWERGKGLVEYSSGWGAEADSITLTVLEE